MNKKLLITIGIILGLAVVAGGFWYIQRYVQDDSQEVANSEQENIEVVENEDQNNKQENQSNNPSKNQISTKQLTKEETEKLKQEKDLVWYEIPELGIKFLVTRDSKDDLRYIMDENVAHLYRHSVVSFLQHNSKIKKLFDNNYSGFAVVRIDQDIYRKYQKNDPKHPYPCRTSEAIFVINKYVYCSEHSQAAVFDSKQQQEDYQRNTRNKNYKIYLNTIRQTKIN